MDVFGNFRQRCEEYGSLDDLASYMIETAHSHPDWESAFAYFDEPNTMLLDEPKPIDRDDECWCAMHLWEALQSLNRMMETPVWTDALDDTRTRIRAMTA